MYNIFTQFGKFINPPVVLQNNLSIDLLECVALNQLSYFYYTI